MPKKFHDLTRDLEHLIYSIFGKLGKMMSKSKLFYALATTSDVSAGRFVE